jgi:hypothetical protein
MSEYSVVERKQSRPPYNQKTKCWNQTVGLDTPLRGYSTNEPIQKEI